MPNEDALMPNQSSLNEALKVKAGCLTPQELEKFVGDSSVSDSHLAECPRCQTELALLRSFESNQPLPGEGAAVVWISKRLEQRLGEIKGKRANREAGVGWFARLFGGRKARWIVPAAAAVIVAALGVALIHRPQEPQLRADAGNGPVVYRSQEIAVTGPIGDFADAPKLLQWKAVPGASKYQASIMEVDEVLLWSSETDATILTIPGAIRAKMLPRKPVLWRVTALDSQGRVLATSQVQRFSVLLKSSGSTSSKSASGVLSR
jgi:hypothetical protein